MLASVFPDGCGRPPKSETDANGRTQKLKRTQTDAPQSYHGCALTTKLVRSLGKISGAAACGGMLRHAAACCGMLPPALVGRQKVSRANTVGADRQGKQADVVPNTFPNGPLQTLTCDALVF